MLFSIIDWPIVNAVGKGLYNISPTDSVLLTQLTHHVWADM